MSRAVEGLLCPTNSYTGKDRRIFLRARACPNCKELFSVWNHECASDVLGLAPRAAARMARPLIWPQFSTVATHNTTQDVNILKSGTTYFGTLVPTFQTNQLPPTVTIWGQLREFRRHLLQFNAEQYSTFIMRHRATAKYLHQSTDRHALLNTNNAIQDNVLI